jgi:hypothetical protein
VRVQRSGEFVFLLAVVATFLAAWLFYRQ